MTTKNYCEITLVPDRILYLEYISLQGTSAIHGRCSKLKISYNRRQTLEFFSPLLSLTSGAGHPKSCMHGLAE